MATSITTITNVSSQVVPILVDSITTNKANPNATIPASDARQLQIAPSAQAVIESQRLDLGQLQRLQDLKVITYTTS